MAMFRYRAVSDSGNVIEGEFAGPSREAVVDRLIELGHTPIAATEIKPDNLPRGLFPSLGLARKVSKRDTVNLTRQLATLLRSGVNLERAFEILIDLTKTGEPRELLGRILGRLRNGAAFADALAVEPKVFAGFYVSMVRAGESSGALDRVMSRLTDFLVESQTVKDKIKSALIYPSIVLAMVFITLVIMLTYVLPRFEVLFQEGLSTLPWPTRAVLAFGDAFEAYWWTLPLVLLAILIALSYGSRHHASRLALDNFLLKSRLMLGLVAKVEFARFARTLGILLGSNVPMIAALGIARDTIGNLAMAEAVETATDGLKKGEGLARSLARTELFPGLAVQLIRVGEETGRLHEMLLEAATIYDREAETTIERLLAILVPALTVGLGLIVAALIGSVLLGILSVNDLAG